MQKIFFLRNQLTIGNRIGMKMYEINSIDSFRWHLIFFKWFGLWPSKKTSILYYIYSTLQIIINFIGWPVTMLACVFYVESVDDIVDHLILSTSCVLASIKSVNVLWHQAKFRNLIEIAKQMDRSVPKSNGKTIEMFQENQKFCQTMLKVCTVAYMSSFCSIVIQNSLAVPEKRIWHSTILYPSEILQKPIIYYIGFYHQAICNCLSCLLSAVLDTYPSIFLHILNGHIDAINFRLEKLGNDLKRTQYEIKRELIDICKCYETCLRLDSR